MGPEMGQCQSGIVDVPSAVHLADEAHFRFEGGNVISRNSRFLVRGAVLEGLGNSGKTSLLRAIKRRQADDEENERSVVVLGEHYSQQLQTIQGELTELSEEEHRHVLSQRVECIEQLNDWAAKLGPNASRRSRGLFFVFERFTIDHRLCYGTSDFVDSIERRLANLSAVCFLLTVSAECIEERMRYRSERTGGSIGPTDVSDWLAKQERYVEKVGHLGYACHILNTDERDWDGYADRVLREVG